MSRETTQLRAVINSAGGMPLVLDERGAAVRGVQSVTVEHSGNRAPVVTIKIYALDFDLTILGKDETK